MNSVVVAVLFGLGVGAWIFNKTSHRTNNVRTSLITATFVGLIVAFVFFTLFKLTFHK
jgi:uncharacterized membrane protein